MAKCKRTVPKQRRPKGFKGSIPLWTTIQLYLISMNKTITRRPYQPKKRKAEHLLNREIRHPEVRITGDAIGESRVVSIQEAQLLADENGLDLVEVTSTATPPVCRICDYSKFMYGRTTPRTR